MWCEGAGSPDADKCQWENERAGRGDRSVVKVSGGGGTCEVQLRGKQ